MLREECYCLFGILCAVFLHGIICLGKSSLAYLHLAHELSRSKVLACLWRPKSLGVVVPVSYVDDVYHLRQLRIGKYGVLGVLCAAQRHHRMQASLFFPFGYCLEPEACEVQRTCIFLAQQLHHVALVLEVVETLADVLLVQRSQYGVVDVVELLGHEYALVACERHRFGKVGAVDIVHRTPRTVNPVGSCLEYVVLKIVLVEQQYAFLCTFFCKLVESHPVPLVRLCKVVAAQSVPCGALSCTAECLLVERSPNVAVGTAHALMVSAAQVIPQSVVVV